MGKSHQNGIGLDEVTTDAGHLAWATSSYRLVRELLLDTRLGYQHAEPRHAARMIVTPMSGPVEPTAIPESDVERTRRSLLAPLAAKRRVELLRSIVEVEVEKVLDELAASADPTPNFHTLVSRRLPVRVVCAVMGVPAEYRDQLAELVHVTARLDEPARVAEAIDRMGQTLRSLLDDRRDHPRGDYLSFLASREQAMTPGELLDIQVGRLATLVVIAGSVTTVAAIDAGLLLLLERPRERRLLADGGRCAERAVEEVLRVPGPNLGVVVPPHIGLTRYANCDFVVGDALVRKGDLVILNTRAANIDPTVFDNPRQFDCDRSPNPHLAFGHGVHMCPGSGLARMELTTLFTRLFSRFPNIALDPSIAEPVYEARTTNRAMVGFPVLLHGVGTNE